MPRKNKPYRVAAIRCGNTDELYRHALHQGWGPRVIGPGRHKNNAGWLIWWPVGTGANCRK